MKKSAFIAYLLSFIILLSCSPCPAAESGIESKAIPAGNLPVSVRPGLVGDSGLSVDGIGWDLQTLGKATTSYMIVDGVTVPYLETSIYGLNYANVTGSVGYIIQPISNHTWKYTLSGIPFAWSEIIYTNSSKSFYPPTTNWFLNGVATNLNIQFVSGAEARQIAADALKADLNGSNIGTNADTFKSAIGVESSVFPALRMWNYDSRMSAGFGVIGDSTGYDNAWPLAIYNILTNSHPEATVRLYQWANATSNMTLKAESISTNGERSLTWTNSTVRLPYFPTWDTMTNYVDISVKAKLADWSDAAREPWICRREVNDPIYFNTGLRMSYNGRLLFYYAVSGGYSIVTSAVSVSHADNAIGWVRVVARADTGVVNFYESTTGTNWTSLGAKTNTIGAFLTNGVSMYLGSGTDANKWNQPVYSFVLKSSDLGLPLTPPIDQWYRSVPGNIVVSGGATFEIWNGSAPGYMSTGWTSTRCKLALPAYISQVILNLGLNDTSLESPSYADVYSRLKTVSDNIYSACSNAQLCVLSQNPWSTTDARSLMFPVQTQRQQTAAKRLGYETIDTYTAFVKAGFTDAWLDDIVHPSWGSQQTNAVYIYNRIFK